MLFAIISQDSPILPKLRPAKVSRVSLPQEYHLARLLERVENLHSSMGTDIPACKWVGVSCDEMETIVAVKWSARNLNGPLNWAYFPNQLTEFDVGLNQLCGEVPFEYFPATLQYLSLPHNKFSGTPNFSKLPLLHTIRLQSNEFHGWINFETLPKFLRCLFLNMNPNVEGALIVTGDRQALFYDIRDTMITSNNGIKCRMY